MKCPHCGCVESRVVDSRSTDEGSAIRRRRMHCLRKAVYNYEKLEEIPLIVVKRNGNRQMFDRAKILNGLIYAGVSRIFPFMF